MDGPLFSSRVLLMSIHPPGHSPRSGCPFASSVTRNFTSAYSPSKIPFRSAPFFPAGSREHSIATSLNP